MLDGYNYLNLIYAHTILTEKYPLQLFDIKNIKYLRFIV